MYCKTGKIFKKRRGSRMQGDTIGGGGGDGHERTARERAGVGGGGSTLKEHTKSDTKEQRERGGWARERESTRVHKRERVSGTKVTPEEEQTWWWALSLSMSSSLRSLRCLHM